MDAKPDVSICVATHRRPQGIARLLDSLGRMKLPAGVGVEVIVVDNDPDAPVATKDWADRLPGLAFRCRAEARRNIAHARNAAVEVARGEWLAFVDDDEVVAEDWLASFWRCAEGGDADAFFGPVLPRLEPGGTPWVSDFFDRPRFATGATLGEANARTGNAFVRRSLFADGAFDAAYGESGGEDTRFFWARAREGARFCWCDEAIVWESVPADRQRPAWLVRRAFRGGCVHARIAADLGRGGARAPQVARRLVAAGVFAAAAIVFAIPDRERALCFIMRAATQLGQVRARLGRAPRSHAGRSAR